MTRMDWIGPACDTARRGLRAFGMATLATIGLALLAPVPADAQSSVRPPSNAVTNAPLEAARPAETSGPNGGPSGGKVINPAAHLWGDLRRGMQGSVSIPDKKAATLIQSEGEDWRSFRNGPLTRYGAWAMAGMLLALAAFYLIRGTIRVEHGLAGLTIVRFDTIERFGHWLMAGSFIVLALTGLNMLYGRYVIEPVLGKPIFATLTATGKWLHNYIAFAFMLGLFIAFLKWVRQNIPNHHDGTWLLQGGGIVVKGVHPPAGKFNMGQKIIFWLVMLGGVSISLSGISLLFPFETGLFAKTFSLLNGVLRLGLPASLTPVQEMQYATSWHAIVALFLVCVIFAHIYIGTIGMEGAFDAMGSGSVDLNWAREHHSLWVDEEMGKAGGVAPSGGPASHGSGKPVPAE